MDYFCLIQSVVSYVENRSKTGLDPKRLETAMGVSYAHLRAVFRERTSIPLGRYALSRRVSNAAFKMVHGSSSILDLALEYGFGNHDSFTRAFKRMTGLTPSQFRAQGGTVGRTKLTGGIYGPSIQGPETVCLPPLRTEDMMNGKEMKRENGSCILYGVPKVAYRYEECTPFPSCLKACLNYMGQELSYAWLMAASGAAFRLRWNTRCWDGGNVDIMMIYDSPTEAFERSFRAAGRSHRFLGRNGGSVKVEFVDFITAEIDQGRPVIALGIIGPPEACIITGYRDGGQTLLGWNFFQENPEFAGATRVDESGYFVTDSWWENPNTLAVMAVGEEQGAITGAAEILANGLEILRRERVGDFAGGQAAYAVWRDALLDESQFPAKAPLPLLFERLMCQIDAVTMVAEGRAYAAVYLEETARQFPGQSAPCLEAAALFRRESELAQSMSALTGGFQMGEQQARNLAKPEVRQGIASLIAESAGLDRRAADIVAEVARGLEPMR